MIPKLKSKPSEYTSTHIDERLHRRSHTINYNLNLFTRNILPRKTKQITTKGFTFTMKRNIVSSAHDHNSN